MIIDADRCELAISAFFYVDVSVLELKCWVVRVLFSGLMIGSESKSSRGSARLVIMIGPKGQTRVEKAQYIIKH